MSDTPIPLDLKMIAIDRAWAALAQRDPASACEALIPWVEETTTDSALAGVWATMLGQMDDAEHLSHELKRLAQRWAQTPLVVTQLSGAVLAWAQRTQRLGPPATPEGLIGLGVQIVEHCLTEAPPSAPNDRAALYGIKARLLSFGGVAGEERALQDYEVSLDLSPDQAEVWYHLGRLHLSRGRWEKARRAFAQAQHLGLDVTPLWWSLAIALTALATPGEEALSTLRTAWSRAGHDDLLPTRDHRMGQLDLPPALIALTTHMVGVSGDYDTTDPWRHELVWVHPLSPCHGRLIHPTLESFPANFDDVVLWDGQPARFEEIDGTEQPIFKAIACLRRGEAHTRLFPLSISMSGPALSAWVAEINERLPRGVFLYTAVDGDPAQVRLCWPRGQVIGEVIGSVEVEVERARRGSP